jgi:hypothetical protein
MKFRSSSKIWILLSFFLVSASLLPFFVSANHTKDETNDAFAGGIGLKAEYFNNISLNGLPVLVRNELVVDNDYGLSSPFSATHVDNFSARWSGKIIAPETGTYRFHTFSDDGVRLWVNGSLIIDNWSIHNPTLDTSTAVKLTRGQRYEIKLEYFESSQNAVIRLMWTPPRKTQRLIPQAYLLPPGFLPVTNTPTPTPTPTPISSQGGTLYVAEMRPESGVVSSGSGFSTLRLAPDERSAIVRFNFSNLTTPVVAAHIHGPANPGTNGPILFDLDDVPMLPDGSFDWTFQQVGHTTIARIVESIKNGRTYINIHTSRYPNGEIRNHYRRGNGSTIFTPPTSNPPLSTIPRDDKDVARFLTQSTFGPTKSEILRVRQMGFDSWLNEQFDAPTTSHLAYLDQARKDGEGVYLNQTMEAFWSKALRGNDQLRQRVAFAMSEIFVLSGISLEHPYGISGYLDTLQGSAFLNFREILRNVTLNPGMGDFLNMLRNNREDIYSGRVPNENFAREINQLFSI